MYPYIDRSLSPLEMVRDQFQALLLKGLRLMDQVELLLTTDFIMRNLIKLVLPELTDHTKAILTLLKPSFLP